MPETIIQVLTEVSQESMNLGDTAWFDCKVQGDPSATVTWSKEGSESLPDNSEVKINFPCLFPLQLYVFSMEFPHTGT